MEKSIALHPELGVNPRLTYCPRCRGESSELLLLGKANGIYRCASCGTANIGKPKTRDGCGKCGHWDVPFERELGPSERLPGSVCDACQEEIKEHEGVVAAGGVYFKCVDCGASGVVKAESPLSSKVREVMKIPPPAPCGVEFSKADGCPACGGDDGSQA